MKQNRVWILFLLLQAAAASAIAQPTFIKPFTVKISCNKTTHLIFPFAIRSIDRGSGDILAQKAPGAEAVLQLKAGRPRFAETNMTVITADNRLYPFTIIYDSLPGQLTLSFGSKTASHGFTDGITFSVGQTSASSDRPDAGTLQSMALQVANQKKDMFSLHTRHALMSMKITGLFVRDDIFYLRFVVGNKSNISFEVQNISISVKDTKKVKRRASQEKVIEPLLSYGVNDPVESHSKRVWVIAMPKFTIEDGKYLSVQVLEQDGGRNLNLKLSNGSILSARKL